MFEEMGPPRPCNPYQAVATGLEHPVGPSMVVPCNQPLTGNPGPQARLTGLSLSDGFWTPSDRFVPEHFGPVWTTDGSPRVLGTAYVYGTVFGGHSRPLQRVEDSPKFGDTFLPVGY
jgi:hypothetical protein